jgi:two-component system CheB/CheR fusion protein
VREIASARRLAENIIDTVRESLLVLDGQMHVLSANQHFYNTFNTVAEQIEGQSLFELGGRLWDIPTLRTLLETIAQDGQAFEGYRIEHRFGQLGCKRLLLNGRLLREESGEGGKILVAIEDITDKTNGGITCA